MANPKGRATFFPLVFLTFALLLAAGGAGAEPFSSASLRTAADYLKGLNGHALLVYYRDQLVFEEYFNGWSADKPHRLASGTKSFSGAMLAGAVEDGLLQLDERVSDTIREWRDHPRKSQVTIRQLLSLTSGIYGGSTRERSPSYSQAVVVADAKYAPGVEFQYGPIPYQIFGEIMRRKLAPKNESVYGYLKRRILDPIGLAPSDWVKDVDGNIHLPNGAQFLAREWAKFGLFIKHKGKWQERQIVPTAVLQECFVGTKANPQYGITFWLRPAVWLPADLVMAHGLGQQILYIVPSLDLVVIHFAESTRIKPVDFLRKLFAGAKAE
ncbi:MAG TPA: serine hydrolase domain-containing protein [Verrucomicrobiae bacterium]|nr:serine hydrolase domain-containing protein [Verrucomicrobiae bacterium]